MKLSYVAMCIDLNEIFLFLILLHENITAGKKLNLVCFTMLIHDHKMCMSVNDLILYSTRYIPVTTFNFFILLLY